jgi:drug/metabolite transporter (DMT)-like permease
MASRPQRAYAEGAAWMVGAALAFSGLLVSVRALAASYPAVELVFVRSLVGILLIAPIVTRHGFGALKTRRLPLHALRAAFAAVAMVLLYYALIRIPVADMTALTFLIPLFTTIAVGTILKERVDAPRWLATAAGFCGALVIVRPGFAAIDLAVGLALLSSVAYAGAWTTIKFLTRTESAAVTVFYLNALALPLLLLPTIVVGAWPAVADLPVLAIMAFCGWAAHFCQARSFAAADASAVMPFDFLRLPFAALLAWLAFGEVSDAWTWIGAVIIFGSGWFIARHEARARSVAVRETPTGR